MSLEDYTLTLTVEDISKFQTPAKELENWQNLTQAQINTILEKVLSNDYYDENRPTIMLYTNGLYRCLLKWLNFQNLYFFEICNFLLIGQNTLLLVLIIYNVVNIFL